MTEWIDVLVYTAFMLILWVGVPIAASRLHACGRRGSQSRVGGRES